MFERKCQQIAMQAETCGAEVPEPRWHHLAVWASYNHSPSLDVSDPHFLVGTVEQMFKVARPWCYTGRVTQRS